MTTALYTHPDFLQHLTPPGHHECAERLEAISRALAAPEFGELERREAPLAVEADILLCHPPEHLAEIRAAIPDRRYAALDADTFVSPGSLQAAFRAVGGNVAAVDAVLAGEVANAFVACRPPGHHAEPHRAMGFCLFGNVAIAAMHALERHGLERVAIVDFDVHHGNGTQALMWNEARVLFASSHQMPLFPGSGAVHERGAHDNILNAPLEPMSGGAQMRRVYESEIFPALETFSPELVLVSAGFDAHTADPLAELNWTVEDFAWLTARICDIAEAHAGGRVVSTLEGGYDLDALAASVAAHVEVLMERGR